MKKIEEEKAYQELLIRRDSLRLVFDIRCFRQLMNSHDNSDFRVKDYLNHMENHSNLFERLRNLLERAQSTGANPNLLDEYQDDLINKTRKLEESYSVEEQEQLKKISREMNSMLFVCKGAKTLCGELMMIYPIFHDNKDVAKQLESAILQLVKTFSQYDNRSYEYFFLMESPYYGEWFLECFKTYFTKDTIPVEEQQKNFHHLLSKITRENDLTAADKMLTLLNYYASLGVVLEKKDFIDLIEVPLKKSLKNSVLSNIGNYPNLMFFTENDYLDLLFNDLINNKSMMPHSNNSPFSGINGYVDEENLISAIKQIIIPLTRISTISMYEFFKLLANKIALLPNHLDTASKISKYLKTLTPNCSNIFEEAYLEASEHLPQERTKFVLTMVEVKKKLNK